MIGLILSDVDDGDKRCSHRVRLMLSLYSSSGRGARATSNSARFPWIRSAGRKGHPRRNRGAGSVALRLVNTANTCSLSFDLVFPGRMERYREVVYSPSW